MSDVFISYARKDRDAVEQIADALEREGLSVWHDQQIKPAEDLEEVIERELDFSQLHCRGLVERRGRI